MVPTQLKVYLKCKDVVYWCAYVCSSNSSETSVTIAGSVCDVQSANETHIVCVTNAQRRSQQTNIRVSIGDRGIAKMVRERQGKTFRNILRER